MGTLGDRCDGCGDTIQMGDESPQRPGWHHECARSASWAGELTSSDLNDGAGLNDASFCYR